MTSHPIVRYSVLGMLLLCAGLAGAAPDTQGADGAARGDGDARADSAEPVAPAMNQARLEALVRALADTAEGGGGVLQFEYDGVVLACVSDVANNRMRIMAPIGDYTGITPQQKDLMLVANFHTALDARYAVSKGVLYAVFVHPLSTLDAQEVGSAVRQVATLMQTFGGAYSSGALNFGSQAGPRPPAGEIQL